MKIDINIEHNIFNVKAITPRLHIRSYQNKDYQQCLSLYSEPTVTKYFDHGLPRTASEIFDYIKSRGRKYFDQGAPYGLFSVFLSGENTFIGQIDLVPTEIPGTVEIGWIFDKQFHNLGYCSEAILNFMMPYIKELIKKSFKANGEQINKVIATAHPDNPASINIIKKAGLSFYKFENRFEDKPRCWYSLTL